MTVLPIADNPRELLGRAIMLVGWSQGELASRSKCSVRTVSRWFAGQSYPSYECFRALAGAVLAKDPAFAAELAAAGHATIKLPVSAAERAPQVAPAAPATPATPPVPPRLLVEAVVCAAAEELDASPRIVRGVLRAAFLRAREMGLTVEGVIEVLGAPVGKAAKRKA